MYTTYGSRPLGLIWLLPFSLNLLPDELRNQRKPFHAGAHTHTIIKDSMARWVAFGKVFLTSFRPAWGFPVLSYICNHWTWQGRFRLQNNPHHFDSLCPWLTLDQNSHATTCQPPTKIILHPFRKPPWSARDRHRTRCRWPSGCWSFAQIARIPLPRLGKWDSCSCQKCSILQRRRSQRMVDSNIGSVAPSTRSYAFSVPPVGPGRFIHPLIHQLGNWKKTLSNDKGLTYTPRNRCSYLRFSKSTADSHGTKNRTHCSWAIQYLCSFQTYQGLTFNFTALNHWWIHQQSLLALLQRLQSLSYMVCISKPLLLVYCYPSL